MSKMISKRPGENNHLMKEKKAGENKKWLSYTTIGMMFPASIAVGLTFGYFLDEFFHTSPYLLIIFTIYGIAAGFWNLIKITNQHGKQK